MNSRRHIRTHHQADPEALPEIIVQGGILLTMKEAEPPLDGARVLVKGDRIMDIQLAGYQDPFPGPCEIIDATNGMIMPGLVNAHCHSAMTLFRGFADDLPLKAWLFEKIFPAESQHLSPETVYWGTLLGCLEMIASGTTTFMDGYFYQDATVEAVHQAGLRALLAQGVIDFPAPGVPIPEKNLEVGRAFIEKWLGFSDLITPGLFCHSPLSCSESTLKRSMELSRDFSLPLQVHLSETLEEVTETLRRSGLRPVPYLERVGILNADLIAAHAVHLDGEELELLRRKKVRPVHVPESNMKLASGVARVADMVGMGLKVAIGTDGCASNNNLDLFREMDTAAKMAKVFSGDPVSLDAETVLKMATQWGAYALGLENEIGTIEVGKKADIIVLDLENPHMMPLYNPFSALVYSASGADVKHVLVNGRILLKDRVFQTLNVQDIIGEVNAIGRRIMGKTDRGDCV
jgi:5-methylthioadenosine/S-adenosylhomocysteine deaminase